MFLLRSQETKNNIQTFMARQPGEIFKLLSNFFVTQEPPKEES